MSKKAWEIAMGERTQNPLDGDELLKDTINERKKKQIARQEEIDEAKHDAELAKLRKQTKTADVAVEKTESKESTGFKVDGAVHLGNIDLDADRKQAALELKELKKEQDETLKVVGRENEALRDKIHEKEMEVLRMSFQAQMDLLTKAIEGNASRGSFADQLNAARAIAGELGYAQPPAASGDLMTQLKLKEIEFNNSIAFRKFDEEIKDRDFQRKLDMLKLEDGRDEKKAEQAREAKKDEMFAKTPEIIGRAIGRAMLEGGGGVAEQPQGEAPITSKGKQPSFTLNAGIGESGDTVCGNCGKPIAIGPTARVAVCANCGGRFPIKRVKPEEVEPPPEKIEAPAEEEEE